MIGEIRSIVNAMRKATFDKSPQWNLGQLIDELSAIKATEDCWVVFDFCDFVPGHCHSWRGSYSELAITPEQLDWDKRPKLTDVITRMKDCVGAEFTGWKGGEYIMDESTPVWVAEDGRSGNTGIVGLHKVVNKDDLAYQVVIQTAYCEF